MQKSMLKPVAVALFVGLVTASCSFLPNDFIQGESVEVKASPKDLYACVTAAVKGVNGVTVDASLYDSRYRSVPLKTSMSRVTGDVQIRSGGMVFVMIGIVSKHSEPEVKAYAAPRVKAIAAGITRECSNG